MVQANYHYQISMTELKIRRKLGLVGRSSVNVVLPSEILDALNLKIGDEVDIGLDGTKIVMEKVGK